MSKGFLVAPDSGRHRFFRTEAQAVAFAKGLILQGKKYVRIYNPLDVFIREFHAPVETKPKQAAKVKTNPKRARTATTTVIARKANPADASTVKMLRTMIESGIDLGESRIKAHDYANANAHLSYVQGVIDTALRTKAISSVEAKTYRAKIKALVK